ncbi:MAG: hypothetical protein JW951_06505, partial [Lentisphaerae bacterium]|nr:hypothetical protein [Lentisphaerota bacterium]
MPLYESRQHTENRIDVKPAWRDALIAGVEPIVKEITGRMAARADSAAPLKLAFDGWYNIDWPALLQELGRQAAAADLTLDIRGTVSLFRSRADIAAYKQAFTETDDPGFGVVNTDGRLIDLMNPE